MSFTGLYIHVPFCIRKCGYCDFYSVTDLSLMRRYVAAVEQEIGDAGPLVQSEADTVYFGGGTPSLLPAEAVERILDRIRASFRLQPAAEITLEINPGTVDADRLRRYRCAGVNRLSIGVQSFRPQELEKLGRLHSADEARQTLHSARRAGFDNLGIDLIYAIPGQTPDHWRANLETAIDFSPEHFSCYGLTFEPGTPLAEDLQCGRIVPAEDHRVAELYRIMVESLGRAGYLQYEVSNFCRAPHRQSRHNRKYWNFEAVIGLGPAAHSYLPPHRFWNVRDVHAYIRALEGGRSAVEDRETVTCGQAMLEAIYLGLRQTRGIDPLVFERRFQVDFTALFGKLTQRFSAQGLMTLRNGCWRLTVEGMLLLDRIVEEMVACLPDE